MNRRNYYDKTFKGSYKIVKDRRKHTNNTHQDLDLYRSIVV